MTYMKLKTGFSSHTAGNITFRCGVPTLVPDNMIEELMSTGYFERVESEQSSVKSEESMVKPEKSTSKKERKA